MFRLSIAAATLAYLLIAADLSDRPDVPARAPSPRATVSSVDAGQAGSAHPCPGVAAAEGTHRGHGAATAAHSPCAVIGQRR